MVGFRARGPTRYCCFGRWMAKRMRSPSFSWRPDLARPGKYASTLASLHGSMRSVVLMRPSVSAAVDRDPLVNNVRTTEARYSLYQTLHREFTPKPCGTASLILSILPQMRHSARIWDEVPARPPTASSGVPVQGSRHLACIRGDQLRIDDIDMFKISTRKRAITAGGCRCQFGDDRRARWRNSAPDTP